MVGDRSLILSQSDCPVISWHLPYKSNGIYLGQPKLIDLET